MIKKAQHYIHSEIWGLSFNGQCQKKYGFQIVATNLLEFVTTLNYFGANWLLEEKVNFMARLYLLGRLLLVAEK